MSVISSSPRYQREMLTEVVEPGRYALKEEYLCGHDGECITQLEICTKNQRIAELVAKSFVEQNLHHVDVDDLSYSILIENNGKINGRWKVSVDLSETFFHATVKKVKRVLFNLWQGKVRSLGSIQSCTLKAERVTDFESFSVYVFGSNDKAVYSQPTFFPDEMVQVRHKPYKENIRAEAFTDPYSLLLETAEHIGEDFRICDLGGKLALTRADAPITPEATLGNSLAMGDFAKHLVREFGQSAYKHYCEEKGIHFGKLKKEGKPLLCSMVNEAYDFFEEQVEYDIGYIYESLQEIYEELKGRLRTSILPLATSKCLHALGDTKRPLPLCIRRNIFRKVCEFSEKQSPREEDLLEYLDHHFGRGMNYTLHGLSPKKLHELGTLLTI